MKSAPYLPYLTSGVVALILVIAILIVFIFRSARKKASKKQAIQRADQPSGSDEPVKRFDLPAWVSVLAPRKFFSAALLRLKSILSFSSDLPSGRQSGHLSVNTVPDISAHLSPSAPERRQKPFWQKFMPYNKAVFVGVDINDNHLRLVKLSRSSPQKLQLLAYREVVFENGLSMESPLFSRFLKEALTRFCGASEKIKIWSAFPPSDVDTRHIKIPRVSGSQIANAVYWTYRKEVPFDETDVVFDYEILGEIREKNVQKLEVMAYSAPRREIEKLKELFIKSGFPLAGITIFPFAFQNFLRAGGIKPSAPDTCSLFIGMDWSSISIFRQDNLMLSRGIRAGMSSMVEAIRDEIKACRQPNGLFLDNGEESRIAPEPAAGMNADEAYRMLLTLIQNPVAAPDVKNGGHAGKKDVFDIIRPVLERLIGQIERTLKHYALNFGERNIGRIFVSGELSASATLVEYIGKQLELAVETIDPFSAIPAPGVAIPAAFFKKVSFLPAFGLALAANPHTPNFILTYKDKARQNRMRQQNRILFGGFLTSMLICAAFYSFQAYRLDKQTTYKNQLQQQMETYPPGVDQARILQQVARIKERNLALAEYARKYQGLAIISELANSSPSDVRLTRMSVDLVPERSEKAQPLSNKIQRRPEKTAASKKTVSLEGLVFGDRQHFSMALAAYLVRLKQSPLFGSFSVKSQSFDVFEQKEVLRFSVHLEMI
ncbi:MAG: pilus assembly protein PilM [Desulfobacterales bacterium]|nr:pilus assembly protein PilM [Desulfobacterales bacterium]MDD4392850.1 pilus assembly protein PilM [Desulfobacterales bacterium]